MKRSRIEIFERLEEKDLDSGSAHVTRERVVFIQKLHI